MSVKRTKADAFMLRLPEGMRDRLREAADANGRSMNSEIVVRLQNALDRQDDGSIAVWLPPEVLARVHDAANTLETDPNLLIMDAVETAFPPKRTVTGLAQELLEQIAGTEHSDEVVEAIASLINRDLGPDRASRPWGKSGK